MRAKYVFQWFPPIIEEPLEKIKIKEIMNEYDREMLKNELGVTMFGEDYDITGIGNPELPSRLAGDLGAKIKKWQNTIMDDIILKQDV
ncbi:MAG: hypothetical protein K0R18_3 [Bacillales bacterium]|nr:hypothetical protein [Bacillales bacterium]